MLINTNYGKQRFILLQSIIIVFAGLVAASFVFHWIPIEVARYTAVIILATQFWFEIKIGQKLFLTSPPFLMSFIAIFFFCFLQGMFIYLPEIPSAIPSGIYGHLNRSLKAVGSDAERYIASFSMVLLITHAIAIFFIKINPSNKEPEQIKRIPYLREIFIFSILILTATNILYFYSQLDQTAYAFETLRSLSPPLQSFMLIYLTRQWRESSKKTNTLLIILFIISLSGMFAIHEGKIPVFIALTVLFYWLRITEISTKRVILTGMIAILICIGGIQLLWAVKLPNFSSANYTYPDVPSTFFDDYQRDKIKSPFQIKEYLFNTEMLPKVLTLKLIWRQTNTINCFKNVLENHWNQVFLLSNQLFWVKGLVPRAIWSEKPSLSFGREYAYRYCERTLPRKTGHSASITLLGQPIIHGGWLGLIVHGAILIIILGGLATLSRNPHSLSSASIAALLPWLIDFDQDFTMYIANASKFFLVMLPMICISSLYERKKRRLLDV